MHVFNGVPVISKCLNDEVDVYHAAKCTRILFSRMTACSGLFLKARPLLRISSKIQDGAIRLTLLAANDKKIRT